MIVPEELPKILRTKTKAALSKQIPNEICLASYMCSPRCLSHVSNVFSALNLRWREKSCLNTDSRRYRSTTLDNQLRLSETRHTANHIDFVYLSAAFVPSFGAGPRQIDSKRNVWCVWLVSFVNAYGNLCCRPLNWLLSHCANEICQMLRRIVGEAWPWPPTESKMCDMITSKICVGMRSNAMSNGHSENWKTRDNEYVRIDDDFVCLPAFSNHHGAKEKERKSWNEIKLIFSASWDHAARRSTLPAPGTLER